MRRERTPALAAGALGEEEYAAWLKQSRVKLDGRIDPFGLFLPMPCQHKSKTPRE